MRTAAGPGVSVRRVDEGPVLGGVRADVEAHVAWEAIEEGRVTRASQSKLPRVPIGLPDAEERVGSGACRRRDRESEQWQGVEAHGIEPW